MLCDSEDGEVVSKGVLGVGCRAFNGLDGRRRTKIMLFSGSIHGIGVGKR